MCGVAWRLLVQKAELTNGIKISIDFEPYERHKLISPFFYYW